MTCKIAVVTGGSLGLGREVARELVSRGYKVAIFGRSRASLDEAVADLANGVVGIQADVGDNDSVASAFVQVDDQLGPVDTLVNAAAMFTPFPIECATPNMVQPLVQTNFCGAMYCMRESIARMRKNGGGDIINVSSESVRQSTPFLSVYTATKAALESFTTLMGEELREEGIRCAIFRVGRMHSHGAATIQFPVPDLLDRFIERCQTTGSAYWTGAGMQPASAAAVLVNLLDTPRDARVEMVEVRSH
jgi:NAD(P)-dependent dehydrogenase (short-subunit alcohol dehydrogenase family)